MATQSQLCDSNSPPEPDRTGTNTSTSLPFVNSNSQISPMINNGGFVINQNVLSAYIEQHNREMEQFIRIQNENMRLASILIRQKDEEIESARKMKRELEFMVKKFEIEKQKWQKSVRDNATNARQIQSIIQEAQAKAAAEQDRDSCTGAPATAPATAPETATAKTLMTCSNCESDGEKRVMFLPCGHICCCPKCVNWLHFCLICNTPRQQSIEVLLSLSK